MFTNHYTRFCIYTLGIIFQLSKTKVVSAVQYLLNEFILPSKYAKYPTRTQKLKLTRDMIGAFNVHCRGKNKT